jgi:uncharacterized protein (DUF1778 family)
MARPRKPAHELRSETVKFTVKPSEYLRIQQAAAAAGESLSDYARSMILKGRVVVQHTRPFDHAVFDQIRRIGVNPNQAVHRLHATGRMPPELPRAAATIERLLLRIMADGSEGSG